MGRCAVVVGYISDSVGCRDFFVCSAGYESASWCCGRCGFALHEQNGGEVSVVYVAVFDFCLLDLMV